MIDRPVCIRGSNQPNENNLENKEIKYLVIGTIDDVEQSRDSPGITEVVTTHEC